MLLFCFVVGKKNRKWNNCKCKTAPEPHFRDQQNMLVNRVIGVCFTYTNLGLSVDGSFISNCLPQFEIEKKAGFH